MTVKKKIKYTQADSVRPCQKMWTWGEWAIWVIFQTVYHSRPFYYFVLRPFGMRFI